MATTYTVTSSFAADTTALASEVNQNFTDVLTALNSFDAANLTGTISLARISDLTATQMASTFFLDEDAMTSNSATAVSSQQAIKAYADTKEKTLVTQATAGIFGSWTNLDSLDAALVKDGIYKVDSDGFVCTNFSNQASGCRHYIKIGDTSSVDKFTFTQGGGINENNSASLTIPIPKDWYWRLTVVHGTLESVNWLPIGTGACVKQ